MQTYSHRNTGSGLFARLSYSNAPLLEKLGAHYFEEDPGADRDRRGRGPRDDDEASRGDRKGPRLYRNPRRRAHARLRVSRRHRRHRIESAALAVEKGARASADQREPQRARHSLALQPGDRTAQRHDAQLFRNARRQRAEHAAESRAAGSSPFVRRGELPVHQCRRLQHRRRREIRIRSAVR